MPNLPSRFAFAIFAIVSAGAALTAKLQGDAVAADDCLAAPNGPTPDGRHWRYRIDHATQRHCWSLREAGERASQVAPPSAAVPAKPIAQAATSRSPEDAHAELPPQTRLGLMNPNDAPNPANVADSPRAADAADTNAPLQAAATSRLFDPTALSAAVTTQPAANDPEADVQANAAAAPPPAAAAVPPAATDSPAQGGSPSIPMLLGVIAGALAFAGIIVSIIFKFGSARRSRRRRVRIDRRAIWKSADDRMARSPRPRAKVAPRRPAPAMARDLDDPTERIERLLSRASRRAAT